MGHGNQSGNFWQGEICANPWDIRAMWKTNRVLQYTNRRRSFFIHCKSIELNEKRLAARVLRQLVGFYFFSVVARKSVMRFHASAASAAR
jgi:hypothetical protein